MIFISTLLHIQSYVYHYVNITLEHHNNQRGDLKFGSLPDWSLPVLKPYSGTPLVRPPLLHQKSGLLRGVTSCRGKNQYIYV